MDSQSIDNRARVYGCKWEWCRLSFLDQAALNEHVVLEHVRRAIPVRRRDIAIMKRVEEGAGESLKISDLMVGLSSAESQDSSMSTAPKDSSLEEPSSLPSPPASSPATHSPLLHDRFPTLHPRSRITSPVQDSDNNISHDVQMADAQPSQDQNVPTFAALSSPTGSHASLAIPASPSFSSLVHRPKRKLAFDSPEPQLRKQQNTGLQITSKHSASFTSTDSRKSVEKQLNQRPPSEEDDDEDDEDYEESSHDEDDEDEDEDDDEDGDGDEHERVRGEEDDAMDVSQHSPSAPSSGSSRLNRTDSTQDLYKAELEWPSSNPAVSEELPQSQASDIQIHGTLAEPASFSQPPSQFEQSTFPFHNHNRRTTSQLHDIHTDIDTSASLALSSPAPLVSPTFAVSTPQRQAWYSNPLVRRRSSMKIEHSTSAESTPKPSSPRQKEAPIPTVSPASAHSHRSRTPKKTVFRSGTLNLGTSALPPEPIAEEPEDHLIRDIMAVRDETYDPWAGTQISESSQDMSYPPLQTQAPYQSQSLSQLD